ncbi:MAG: DUF5329 family protein [Cognaticolwellia sp.]
MNLKTIFILISLFPFSVVASSEHEIAHLLKFVKNTDCKYERNGTMHTGAEAAEHINKKYQYYVDDIKSTEDFIKYSATRSKMSGKYYKIHCAKHAPVKSQRWLLAELKLFRQAQGVE